MKEVVACIKKNAIVTVGSLGVGGERGVIYSPLGVAMAETSTQYKSPYKIVVRKRTSFANKSKEQNS